MKTLRVLACVVSCLIVGSTSLQAGEIYDSLGNNLVSLQGRKVTAFDSTVLANTEYYAIYYSAHWCPPCRAFTPKLVKAYNTIKAKNPHFELIFVSSDRSEDDMEEYIKGDKMPWPTLKFNSKKRSKALTKYAGNGIPCLVFVDKEGKVLSDSYVGGQYVGPSKVIDEIKSILAENPPPADFVPIKSTAGTSTSTTGESGGNFDDFFNKK